MKRAILLILCILLAYSACGCQKDTPQLQEPSNFYYCTAEVSYHSSSGVICPEVRETEAHRGDIQKLLEDYMNGPVSQGLVTPFPANTELLSVTLSDGQVYLLLSEEFASLSGVKLSTACSCITLTLAEYCGITAVNFQIRNGQLENKDILTVYPEDIVLMDEVPQKG